MGDRFRAEESAAPIRLAKHAVNRLLSSDPALEAAADWSEVLRLYGVLVSNAVQLSDGSLALYEYIASGNHSCRANCDIVNAGGLTDSTGTAVQNVAILRANKPLLAGDELTYS